MAVVEHPVAELSRVLIVSSDAAIRAKWNARPLDSARISELASGGADALAKLEAEDWSEVLLDRDLHDLDAGEVFRIIRSRYPHVLVRWADAEQEKQNASFVRADCSQVLACAPERDGAALCTPDRDSEEVIDFGEGDDVSVSFHGVEPLPGMADAGPGLEEVFRLARLVGPRRTTVLITGETGTGKELVARGIHEISPRAKGPFVVVNCAAIPEALLEAELFGHARGAFTGAVQSRLGRVHAAHGGTLFLDEVGELPASMQSKLLRFLQDGEVQRLGSSDVFRVDVRVIAATNVDLLRSVQEGRFRQDVYHRLAVFPIELPPLRQRREQIIPLAQLFLKALCEEAKTSPKRFSSSAAAALREHAWTGNVRELQHAVERAFILSEDSQQVRPAHFRFPR